MNALRFTSDSLIDTENRKFEQIVILANTADVLRSKKVMRKAFGCNYTDSECKPIFNMLCNMLFTMLHEYNQNPAVNCNFVVRCL